MYYLSCRSIRYFFTSSLRKKKQQRWLPIIARLPTTRLVQRQLRWTPKSHSVPNRTGAGLELHAAGASSAGRLYGWSTSGYGQRWWNRPDGFGAFDCAGSAGRIVGRWADAAERLFARVSFSVFCCVTLLFYFHFAIYEHGKNLWFESPHNWMCFYSKI